MKVKDLLTDESKWARGAYARNRAGLQVDEHSKEACKFCLTGAVYRCYQKGYDKIFDRIATYMRSKFGADCAGVITWNDKIATFQDIREMLVELDI